MTQDPRDIGQNDPTGPLSRAGEQSLSSAAISGYLALAVAWTALCGSLFFSEVLGWLPCVLCWYQRILMYPLAIIIAVGLLRRDPKLQLYVLPFSTLGACVALYHYLLVKTDFLPPPPCVAGIPCTVDYINWLGFINIPFLALTAFLLITLTMTLWMSASPQDAGSADEDRAAEPVVAEGLGTSIIAVFGIIAAVVIAFVAAAQFV